MTIQNLTGLSIDHYVQVTLSGFFAISEAIDGVTVCLNNAMRPARTTADVGFGFDSGFEPDGTFVPSYSGINLPKGPSTIKGIQALAFVRQRHGLPNGDLDRIKRQQYFLSAVFRKVSGAGTLSNPLRLERLLKAVSSSLTLDKTLDPLKLLQQLQNLTAGNVVFTTIPLAADKFATLPVVGDVVQLDTAAIPNFIDTLIGQDPAVALKNAKPAPPGSFSTDVLNASGVAGRATSNAAALTALGFSAVVGDATPAPRTATTIVYPKGMEGAAKSLAAEVPGASLLRSAAVTEVTLYLGANGVEVATLTPPPSPPKPGLTLKPTPTVSPSRTPALPPGAITAATAGCVD